MLNRVFVLLFLSLIITFTSSYAWAQTPVFDQTNYVFEHNGFLEIDDPNPNPNPIVVNVTSSSGNVEVNLFKIGNSTIYRSNLIHFSETESNLNGDNPVVNVTGLTSIVAEYNASTATAMIGPSFTSSANLAVLYMNPDAKFTMYNYPDCQNFGGDNDGDYICNDWETNMVVDIINITSHYPLPSCDTPANYTTDKLGVRVCPDPDVKDVYIEIDYMKSHHPNVEALEKVVEAFRKAPINNDSTKYPTGINLHIFIDKEIEHATKLNFGPGVAGGFHKIKYKEFGFSNPTLPAELNATGGWTNPADQNGKAQVFYYFIWGHQMEEFPGASGYSELMGNDGIISLGNFTGMVGTMDQQAGTFMHELGHNLGLNHGGESDDEDNCKPNLLSVMSYSRQFSQFLDRPLDYSRSPVGNITNPNSLGNETRLNTITEPFNAYLDCPFVFTINDLDQDFDGVADVCDPQTVISENTILGKNVTFNGEIIIEPTAVLTVNPRITMDFDTTKKIHVNQGGGLLVKSTGTINGSSVDSEPNGVWDLLEDAPMVFGDNGTTRVEHTHQGPISWPSNWQDIRFIRDTAGRLVCPPSDCNGDGRTDDADLLCEYGVELDSVNQWLLINMTRQSQYWLGGAGGIYDDPFPPENKKSTQKIVMGKPIIHQINLTNSLEVGEVTNPVGAYSYDPTQFTICHTPPWDPGSSQTLTVRDWAVESHLAHGDSFGECNGNLENFPIIVKSGSGDDTQHSRESTCDDCFWPSYADIDVGTTVTWINLDGTDTHSITSVFSGYTDPLTKYDYETGEFDNRFFTKGQTFSHTFNEKGIFQYSCSSHPWMQGTINVEPKDPENPASFEINGLCITKEEAIKQKNKRPYLDVERAPLCINSNSDSPAEIGIENVRAARSVNVDNVLTKINKLNESDFNYTEIKDPRGNLTGQLEIIRNYVLSDKMSEALSGYMKFSNSVNLLVLSETGKQQILKVVDQNIISTSHQVPEFEALGIFVLILSTVTIIVLSRKNSFNRIS